MEKIYFITVGRLKKICKENNFIALREGDLSKRYINCKIVFLSRFKNYNDNDNTVFISYYQTTFMDYITNKFPFL